MLVFVILSEAKNLQNTRFTETFKERGLCRFFTSLRMTISFKFPLVQSGKSCNGSRRVPAKVRSREL